MVRRRNNENSEVRGPSSALTQFLKDKGIRSNHIRHGFSRRESANEIPVTGPSGTAAEGSSPGPTASTSALTILTEHEEAGIASSSVGLSSVPTTPTEEVDEEEMAIKTTSSITRVSATSSSKKTIETTVTAKRKLVHVSENDKRKKKGKRDEDNDIDGEAELQMLPAPKARYADRKPGSFAMCAECNKKFTITRYTNAHPDIPGGLLCGPCDKEIGPVAIGAGAGKSFADQAVAKKRVRAVKSKSLNTKEKPALMSLTKCCIEVIGKAIQDVEDFGDIGATNKDTVCQIVCKNRDLTMETVKLFLDVENTSLSLYDCTRLEPEALRMLANHCPNLETLKLYMCGFMDNETIAHYGSRLTKLKHLQLYAAFLVRKDAWIAFFTMLKQQDRGLSGFMLKQSPRIDNSVLSALVESCNLTHLQLAECGALDDSSMLILHPLKNLRYLDLSHGGLTGETFTDDGIIPLLDSVGAGLITLILDDNLLLTDRTLIEGVKVNCSQLIELSLRNFGEILSTGVVELFNEDWINKKGFVRLNLHRCTQLDDDALEAIVKHSGSSLLKLDLNSVDGLREKSLKALAENAPNLTDLDVSFVREIDDFLLKHFLDKLPSLKRISIYGNNRISDLCPSRLGVKVLGHEQGVVSFD